MTYDYVGADAPRGPTAPHAPLTAYPGIRQPGGHAEAAIDKLMAYRTRRRLGGAFFWELAGDTDDGALINAISRGLH
jgi:hypothetical protein